jgi:hypothetical protein
MSGIFSDLKQILGMENKDTVWRKYVIWIKKKYFPRKYEHFTSHKDEYLIYTAAEAWSFN